MLGCRRWDWISISRRSWCSTFECCSCCLYRTCGSGGGRGGACPRQPPPVGAAVNPRPTHLERHDELALLLPRQVHVAELPAAQWPAYVKVPQLPPKLRLCPRGRLRLRHRLVAREAPLPQQRSVPRLRGREAAPGPVVSLPGAWHRTGRRRGGVCVRLRGRSRTGRGGPAAGGARRACRTRGRGRRPGGDGWGSVGDGQRGLGPRVGPRAPGPRRGEGGGLDPALGGQLGASSQAFCGTGRSSCWTARRQRRQRPPSPRR